MNENVNNNVSKDLEVFKDLFNQVKNSPDVLIYKKEGLNNV